MTHIVGSGLAVTAATVILFIGCCRPGDFVGAGKVEKVANHRGMPTTTSPEEYSVKLTASKAVLGNSGLVHVTFNIGYSPTGPVYLKALNTAVRLKVRDPSGQIETLGIALVQLPLGLRAENAVTSEIEARPALVAEHVCVELAGGRVRSDWIKVEKCAVP